MSEAYHGIEAWRDNFRLTAKNSVEHISPQTVQSYDSNKVPESVRDSFGNLALVSRSLNSEFSNKTFLEKREKFRESNKTATDSLKMALIYAATSWGEQSVKNHQAEMFALLDKYLRADDPVQGHANDGERSSQSACL